MTRPIALAAAVTLLFANAALAQRPDRPRARPGAAVRVETGATVTHVRRLSTVIGANVTLHDGHVVGPVEDIVLNEDGCIDYVVIAYEDQYLPVPWSFATVNFEERVLVLDLDEARLLRAPMFRGDDWSVLIQADWTGRVSTYYQADRRTPGRERARGDRRERGDRERGDRDNARETDDPRDADGNPRDENPDRPRGDAEQPTEADDAPSGDDAPADDAAPSEGEAPADPQPEAPAADPQPEAPAADAEPQSESPTPPQPNAGEGEPRKN
jgi:sporulation protein YlmC with PRC-barrel domain